MISTDGLSLADFKTRASKLRTLLLSHGVKDLGHMKSLEALSRVHGYENWHATSKALQSPERPILFLNEDDLGFADRNANKAALSLFYLQPHFSWDSSAPGSIWTAFMVEAIFFWWKLKEIAPNIQDFLCHFRIGSSCCPVTVFNDIIASGEIGRASCRERVYAPV